MKNLRRVASLLTAAPLAITGLAASAGAASAAPTGEASASSVVVAPGKAGRTCSGYAYADSDHQRYWQTCAWADYRYIWFTVEFGNSSDVSWSPHLTYEDYIKSGVPKTCINGHEDNFYVEKHSTRGTERQHCVITRVPGAYASVGKVWYNSSQTSAVEQHSPTLQVQ